MTHRRTVMCNTFDEASVAWPVFLSPMVKRFSLLRKSVPSRFLLHTSYLLFIFLLHAYMRFLIKCYCNFRRVVLKLISKLQRDTVSAFTRVIFIFNRSKIKLWSQTCILATHTNECKLRVCRKGFYRDRNSFETRRSKFFIIGGDCAKLTHSFFSKGNNAWRSN